MRFIIIGIALLLLATPAARAEPPKKDKKLEGAVDKALVFLKNQQHENGGWSAGQAGGANAAITGLCVMAFLSAGHVPGEGPYAATLEKGVRFVLKSQHPNGLIATEGGHEMYHHGVCTLMLAEVAGMTEGPLADEVRKKLEKAVAVILKAQRKGNDGHGGGWRYNVDGTDSDISVTGWQVMALRAAKNLGCDVPPEAIERAVKYIKRCQDPYSGAFKYQHHTHPTVACTGTSILALEICGKDQHRSPEILKAAGYLLKHPPRWGEQQFSYSMYYCSQATFQLGGQYWNSYREQMHKVLFANRSDSGGWFGADSVSQIYGAKYTTAMAVLALTVEYRYLPIYQRGEEPTDKER
jgi:prenyltransferase beta subunit